MLQNKIFIGQKSLLNSSLRFLLLDEAIKPHSEASFNCKETSISINQHLLSEFYFGKFSQAENGNESTFIKGIFLMLNSYRASSDYAGCVPGINHRA